MSEFIPLEKIDKSWSPQLAYAIGLITADGKLYSNSRHIGFVSKDKELVENLKEALGLKNKISKEGRSGTTRKEYFLITFGDVKFCKFLNDIGITPNKSKTIKEVDVPDKYFDHFLRGLFDGDGTFYTFWDKRWPNSFGYQVSFASASEDFIKWLKSRLTELYEVKGFIRKGDGVFNLRYVKGDSFKLFKAMYGGKEGSLFLKRKYNKMSRALKFDCKI